MATVTLGSCAARVLAAFLVLSNAEAQWSTDPAVNLAVADGASDQVQPKLVPSTTAGSNVPGVWLGWFDGIATGYDVRLQRLDVAGNECFPHGGLLVADRNFTSTQDYGIDHDRDGGVLLAFRFPDSLGGTQVWARRLSLDGEHVFVAIPAITNEFVGSPKIAFSVGNDGLDYAYVAWTQGDRVVLHRRDGSNGSMTLGAPVVFLPPSGSYALADLKAAGADVIVSLVHQTGGFGSPRQLRAAKVADDGTVLWGGAPVDVFASGSLQLGAFPSFEPDGVGGAVFGWYESGPPLQCRVQRLFGDGTPAFGVGGVVVSTDTVRQRVDPAVIYDEATAQTYVFWEELDATQALSGLYGQRLDASGARLWTDAGIEFVPLGPTQVTGVDAVRVAGATSVFWFSSPSFGQDTVQGLRVDDLGAVVGGSIVVGATPSGKSRLVAVALQDQYAVAAWSDDRVDSGDVLLQDVDPAGAFGGAGMTSYCTAKASSDGCLAGIGTASLPFFGGTLCVQPPIKRGPIQFSFGFSGVLDCNGFFSTRVNDGNLVPSGLDAGPGNSAWYQYWYRDPMATTALSNALRLDFQ